jgi:ribonuclease D
VAAVFRQGQAAWPQRQKRVKSRMTDTQRDAVDKLCTKRDEIASGLDVEGSLLGSRSDLEQLIIDPATENPLMEWQEALLRPAMSELSFTSKNGTEPA